MWGSRACERESKSRCWGGVVRRDAMEGIMGASELDRFETVGLVGSRALAADDGES